MVTRREWYERVNAAWPKPLPALTGPEAVRATRRLLRFCKLGKRTIELTSGNRHTWSRGGVFYVNASKGWHELVHMIAHYSHWLRSQDAPHSRSHARLELRLVKEVVRRGWLDGRLKDRVQEPRPEVPEIEKVQALLRRAETRLKRATTIHKKWARRLRRLQKAG